MTTLDSSSRPHTGQSPAPPFWVCLLLGAVMIAAGFLVLGDVVFVTVISTMFIGWVAIITGAFEIIHAFWTNTSTWPRAARTMARASRCGS